MDGAVLGQKQGMIIMCNQFSCVVGKLDQMFWVTAALTEMLLGLQYPKAKA